VADISTGVANWQSDLRIFNPTSGPITATLNYYPEGAPNSPVSRQVTINGGQVLAMNNVLESTFGVTNGKGAVHVDTANESALVVTARTYDQRPSGTYGQFIPAVTSTDAAGPGDRPLQVLQVEHSDRYRSNLGLTEVSGQPVTVEIAAIIPGRSTAPIITETLAANEYKQLNGVLAARMGVTNAYNVRLVVRVVGGSGRVASYISTIDNLTQDPTYVPAQ
jgi:hypothetical protein